MLFMLGYGAVSFIAGVSFYRMGAWPVFGFFGLDVALVYWAFRANYRSGRQTEIIEVTPTDVIVRAATPGGREMRWSANPYWLRIELTELAGDVCELQLTSMGRWRTIGRFLSDPERRELAVALRQAIQAAR